MIRSIYIFGEQSNIIYSKEYADSESKESLVEFLVNLTQFLRAVGLDEQTEFMNISSSRFFYTIRKKFTFVFVADKADDPAQIEEKMGQLVDLFIRDFASLPDPTLPKNSHHYTMPCRGFFYLL